MTNVAQQSNSQQGENTQNNCQNQEQRLRAGKPQDWFERLMKEEPGLLMKGAPRPNSSKVRLRPKICEAILGGAIPEFKKDDYRNLHPDDLQTLICAAFGYGKANVAGQALKECEWDFTPLTAEQKTLVHQGLKNGNAGCACC